MTPANDNFGGLDMPAPPHPWSVVAFERSRRRWRIARLLIAGAASILALATTVIRG